LWPANDGRENLGDRCSLIWPKAGADRIGALANPDYVGRPGALPLPGDDGPRVRRIFDRQRGYRLRGLGVEDKTDRNLRDVPVERDDLKVGAGTRQGNPAFFVATRSPR